jgi:uncharacterized protein (DUF39 family)
VPACAGLAAVDAYIGATELSETAGMEYGGAHVIEDLIAGRKVRLKATSYGTDCYPRRALEAWITKDSINEAYMFNPRNCYQNYGAATNSSDRTIYTYMGTLLPHFGNVNYCTAGELSPLINDPFYRTIGLGSRIFLGGAQGYVAWQGTQNNPSQPRAENGVPIGGAACLALIGDLKQMDPRYIRAARFEKYGVTMFVGVGTAIPLLDEEMVRFVAVQNRDIKTKVFDYSVGRRSKPALAEVSYEELRSGSVQIGSRTIPTAPLSSLKVAREIAQTLKGWIARGEFLLQQPVAALPLEGSPTTLDNCEGE